MDNQALIAVIASDRQAFRAGANDFLVDGPSVEFVYVDIYAIQKARKRVRYDGIVRLPCSYEMDQGDIEEAVEYIQTFLFRADTSIE